MNNHPVTVHALSHITQRQVQPSDFDTDTEDATLLSRGRAIAHAAYGTTEWQTPDATSGGSHWQEGGHPRSRISWCSTHWIHA